ncbi:hypothetical protein TREMEDRAFT_34696 [Tremella mesenterica DSM 1558]|uniref:uncharacterized protein n=1 Tax=Tremella mesenterica (strain ATCC 24925 / CBS 8224 / DSM 1558 / NBRC 9311 / NRRL Y-6157 / RJB 2259-6 / UBC 559-6) TaxID=578456 RepID=UPI00032CE956|nr:uncharacterized protein TREMEDRAFT_34696 [Tremella mesenterica DSM 1558]EIW66757.1 hypothetical protein TREMEDRAFT_34696 [Tremella mesenterica DSM 1558]
MSPLSYLVISGGTGANSIASAFGHSPAFVLPVSDDGGSSAEILRCFSGPSIGDIRSRLVRLIPLAEIPSTEEEKERLAIHSLMAYRFPPKGEENKARDLWMEIVEGRSFLWEGIREDKKECIRAFLVHFQTLCLRRAHKRFSFRNFSLGNGFLTGARDLFSSLPSAIFLFKAIAGVDQTVAVIPVINTNQTITIAAHLRNGNTLVGQCSISHPTSSKMVITSCSKRLNGLNGLRRDSRTFDTHVPPSPIERGTISVGGGIEAPELVITEEEGLDDNVGYMKGEKENPLEAPVERVYYINLYGQEIYPEPNPDFLFAINQRDILVYSCGSLWTSIIPCLALRGLGMAIATSTSLKAKVLLLNSRNDRETPHYKASDYVKTILTTLRTYDRPTRSPSTWEARRLFTHLVYLVGGEIEVDSDEIEVLKLVCVPREIHGTDNMFTVEAVEWAMSRCL